MLPPAEQGALNQGLRRSPASVSPSVHGTMIPPSQGHREAQRAEASEAPSTQWALDQSSDLPGRGPPPQGLAVPQRTAGSVIFNCDSSWAVALKAAGRPQGEQHPGSQRQETAARKRQESRPAFTLCPVAFSAKLCHVAQRCL